MKFSYSEYIGPEGFTIFRPTIPIIFKNKTKFLQTEALVDSGADFTILPIEIAGILDIKLDLRTKKIFHGAGNNPFTVYHSPIVIEHIIRQGNLPSLRWKSKIFFAEAQPIILLGQKGFLEDFKVIFDGERKQLEICTVI